ncbi:TPA: hypothetical protein N0F65_001209 [Lagenidium giganteum]|uniref:Retrovirus-related Pol polyprotein from transposon TNT 1-94-like beta-barrel domain-containing protein n=1 Tax=Lagenidium giganteum TaxID=4803 RepID=A0AAV2Z5V5_9STRA|nr:TPA: hypothetical protein N0F65_001209 [Lagenidium giganteum]
MHCRTTLNCAIIAQGIEREHQSKIRNATSARQAWSPARLLQPKQLAEPCRRPRRLHEFKMGEGSSIATHLDRFGELVMAMEAVGDAMDATRQMVILLGSLPQEYGMIVTVIENSIGLTLDDVKEKLLRHYEKLQQQEPAEVAFKANLGGARGRRPGGRGRNEDKKKPRAFKGKCFACGKVAHKKAQCKKKKKQEHQEEMPSERVKQGNAWFIDSGASSHMSSNRGDFTEYRELPKPILLMAK